MKVIRSVIGALIAVCIALASGVIFWVYNNPDVVSYYAYYSNNIRLIGHRPGLFGEVRYRSILIRGTSATYDDAIAVSSPETYFIERDNPIALVIGGMQIHPADITPPLLQEWGGVPSGIRGSRMTSWNVPSSTCDVAVTTLADRVVGIACDWRSLASYPADARAFEFSWISGIPFRIPIDHNDMVRIMGVPVSIEKKRSFQ